MPDGKHDTSGDMNDLTIKEICEVANVSMPEKFAAIQNKKATSFVCKTFFVKKDSIYFCRGFLGNAAIATDADSEKEAQIAYEKGAMCIVSKKQYFQKNGEELPCLIVADPLDCFIQICRIRKQKLKALTVAITGSVGKTTTKEMVTLVAKEKYKTFASGPTSNDFATIAQIIQSIRKDTEIYIQEVGGFSPGFVERSSKVLMPNACIVTNIGVNHIDLYGSKENILKDKICVADSLPENGGVAFLNYDDPLLSKTKLDCKVVYFSMDNPEADFYARNVSFENDGISFDIVHSDGSAHVKLRTYGYHNVINAVVAFAFGKYLEMGDQEIVSALEKYESKGIRQNLCNIGGYRMLIDCYNVSPDTVVESVKTLTKIPTNGNKKIVILGDVARMGDLSEDLHTKMGEKLMCCDIDTYLMYGKYVEHTARVLKSAGKRVYYTADRMQLNQWIFQHCHVGDSILICGHHESHLDKSIDYVWGTSFYLNDSDMVLLKSKNWETDKFVLRSIDHMIEIRNCKSNDASISVPAHIDGHSVVRIADSAFRKKLNLTALDIAEGIYNIGDGAFYICVNLKQLKLPSTLKVIEDSAFNYCKALEEVELPDSVISIGKRAFYDCINLKKVTINSNVNYIGDEAFTNCPNLTVYCYASTYAHDYAVKNNINYVVIDQK